MIELITRSETADLRSYHVIDIYKQIKSNSKAEKSGKYEDFPIEE